MSERERDRRALPGSGEVSHAYDRWAASYDSDRNATRDLDARVVREHGPACAGLDVVELGCGTGKNTAWLAERARSVVALDFSAGMLARARERVPSRHVRFVHQDITKAWPLDNASADVVIGNLVLEHVNDLAPVMREAARVLHRGGTLFLCELHPDRQQRGGQAHFTEESSGETVHVPAFVHTVDEYLESAQAAGFHLARVESHLESGAPDGALPRLLALELRR